MSRVGRLPVTVPAGVEVNIKDHLVEVKGPKGKLSCEVHQEMQLSQEDNKVFVIRSSDEKQSRALHGLTRTQIQNMVDGVVKGFPFLSKLFQFRDHHLEKTHDDRGVNIGCDAHGKDR